MTRAGAALLLFMAVASAPALAASEDAGLRADLAQWQRLDARLNAVGWRLATGNARFCGETHPAIGLLLRDAASFADPAAVRDATGADITVEAVAPGSPAEREGLRAGQPVEAIDGIALAGLATGGASDWRRLARIHATIESSLADDGQITLLSPMSADQAAALTIAGVPACPGRFEVVSGKRASADGSRIAVGRDFAPFAYPEPLFAAAVAHELAHNLLGHRAWLDAHGRSKANVRLTEREADRLAPWLLANAGYPPEAMRDLMRRWGPEHGGGLLRKRDHDGWDERADAIAAEIGRLARYREENGAADWPRHFVRDTVG